MSTKKIGIVVDNTSEIKNFVEYQKKHNIKIVYTPMFIDEEAFTEDMFSQKEFFEMIDNSKSFPTTSQPSPQSVLDVYQELKSYMLDVDVVDNVAFFCHIVGCDLIPFSSFYFALLKSL